MTDEPPGASDRLARQRLDAGVARRRRRRTRTRASRRRPRSVPSIAPEWEDPAGVPIDAFIFGGRRSTIVPLVTEALDWEHGVFIGATMCSEKTAAAAGTVGELRLDPFAMLPFCGYNMGDYFAHWLEIGRKADASASCRRSSASTGSARTRTAFLWPGFGENSRVLSWMFDRCAGRAAASETPIGLIPPADGEGIDTDGLGVSRRGHGRVAARRCRGVEGPAPAVPRSPCAVREPAAGAARAARRARSLASAKRRG